MSIYEMQLVLRCTDVRLRSGLRMFAKEKLMVVDGIGLFVRYDDEKRLTPAIIRSHLIGGETTYCYVEADSPDKAINKFYAEWEGAKIGGETPGSKALRIDSAEEIVELPFCSRQRKNKKGEFICGDPLKDGQGEFGMCIIEGYDAPDDCVIAVFHDKLYKAHEKGIVKVETVKGFRFVRANQFV
ncbi:MAG: hypothetical protein WC297_00130 [Candidatus Paceibacterota bacterium]|jgi:hypothetical protein